MTINILTNNSCPNSRAFNCPLLLAKKNLRRRGFDLRFFNGISREIFSAEILFINSNVFRPHLKKTGSERVFDFLSKARNSSMKILWFDTSDSAWCTQFMTLPYVDIFLKGQVFANQEQYLVRYRTGRIFTDYFADLYGVKEQTYDYCIPPKNWLSKIRVSWNSCFENYTENRYRIFSKIGRRLRARTWNFIPEKLNILFSPPAQSRKDSVSCRIGLSHNRPSVVAHRKAIIKILESKNVTCNKISLPKYFDELRNSMIGISPFGVGEITLRDFEIIICGAALVKPDMSHMKTWPELFSPQRTYAPHKWDLSDFASVLDSLINSPDYCRHLAENAQNAYKRALSEEGINEFSERLANIASH